LAPTLNTMVDEAQRVDKELWEIQAEARPSGRAQTVKHAQSPWLFERLSEVTTSTLLENSI
jgi:hypothetical protein